MVNITNMRLKKKSKKILALFCLSALLVSLLSTNLIEFTVQINEIDNQASIKDIFIPKMAWYNNSEAPISIDSSGAQDWTWARSQPWCSKGDGSWSDPYIIENVTIDSGSGFDDCIEIRNSHDAYFRIQNCTLFNGTSGATQAGIHLVNTSKGLLIDNDCSYNYYGIYLEGSNNNTIQGNLAHHSTLYGIWLNYIQSASSFKSYNNTLLDNRCYNNSLGIRLNDASDIIITGNTCYNNSNTGIYLDSNNFRAKIIGNDCYNNTFNGLSVHSGCFNTTVQGNNFYYNEKGIALSMAGLITIEGNNCSFNTYGIFLTGSDNNTIKENIVNNNKNTGITLAAEYILGVYYFSLNNDLLGNDCNYNGFAGISLERSGNTEITGNDCYFNSAGIYLQQDCLDNSILRNNCSFNGHIGIDVLDNSHRTTVIGNNCSYNNAHGMEVMNCNDFTIINNTMSHNGKTIVAYCGLSTDSSNNMNITGNVFNDNIYAGIELDGNNINASLNTCSGNNLGIYIKSGTANEVAWNTLIGNIDCIIDFGTGTNIHDNICGNRPSNFVMDSDAENPDNDGSFTLTWNPASGAVNYTVYEYSGYITAINSSLGLPLASEITDLTLPLTGYSNGTYYFIVVAHNDNGDTLSNCLIVTVGIVPEEPGDGVIPGYPLYLLLTFFIVVTLILIKKKREKLPKFLN